MVSEAEKKKQTLIDRAVAAAKRRAGKGKSGDIETFLRQFYANVSALDLAEQDPKDVAGAAIAVWKFAHERKPGKTKIRVYNPRAARDGWDSPHTHVEIVNDDMPFLVDSVTAELGRLDMVVHLSIHPVIRMRRNKAGRTTGIVAAGASNDDAVAESIMSVAVNQQIGDERLEEIRKNLARVLADVRAAVEDWRTIRSRVQNIIDELKLRATDTTIGDMAEAQDFLQWAHDDNFTFLGYREYGFKGNGAKAQVVVDSKAGLGILRDPRRETFAHLTARARMPDEIRAFIGRPSPLMVSKADQKSVVHRPVHMDAIVVKRFDATGKVVGARIIVGLFTSVAYNRSPREIPLLRRKVDKTVARAGFSPTSHDGKALLNILETFPRDELFQIDDDELYEIATGILHLQERQRVALFLRVDSFERFVSCLVYVPRERFNTEIRIRIQDILEEAFGGETTSYTTQLVDSPLGRLHFIIGTQPGKLPDVDPDEIEEKLVAATRSWSDHLHEALIEAYGEERGHQIGGSYGRAFPSSYTERFDAQAALRDISKVEQAIAMDELAMDLYRTEGMAAEQVRFKVFHPDEPMPLSDILPMLENMGFKVIDEVPHAVRVTKPRERLVMIHDLGLITRDGTKVNLEAVRDNIHAHFPLVWRGDVENDGFCALIVKAGLGWRQVVLLRTYAKYLRQAAIPYSQSYMEQTLANNPDIVRNLVKLFEAHFDPAQQATHNRKVIKLRQDILDGLNEVESADEDRIIRRFFNLIESTLRTNFYQPDAEGNPKSYVAVKLDSRALDDLPLPRPFREIWVYSPRFEAIHLRGGKVARGGLRWSDRPEDFRTEILGLMKAQMVKNAVIVPVGSKGGFVVKRPPVEGGRDAFIAEGIACYKTFISGLLDITDNLKGASVVPPKHVIRLDDDDPYLVVAADKGTATFSDIANGVAIDYGFWLGDAFASGGSVGYDHKKMGITARGAWESVKRHFREMGHDIQREDFTVVGVGDMSGDVFGNGMLLSKHIKLLAAFNHLHIFVDPDPDPAKSWAERNRLFKLPRSSWTDYDAKLISKGGGVYERRAKSITISTQARDALGLSKTQLTPEELMRGILLAQVDLLWFGGIGTYIKSSGQTNADAGDRTNDGIRVNGNQVRAKVIGEGANLGVTQLGRIEYGLAGGRLNTDAVDNSAGVDCSDHEVNIKILLDAVVEAKKLKVPARNKLLGKMTDEVGHLVLRDNYLQSQAITLIESSAPQILDEHVRFMRMLERNGRLDRAVEFLPNDETLEERMAQGLGLTRPEISVIMPYAKMWLYDQLLSSDIADDPVMEEDLIEYFPTALRNDYVGEIRKHRLAHEIISTVVTNDLINRAGAVFVNSMADRTGASPPDIARAFIITRDAFGLADVWRDIEALDNKVPAEMQTTMLERVNRLLERATIWILRNYAHPINVGSAVAELAPGITELAEKIRNILPVDVVSQIDFRAKGYEDQGVPAGLARRVAYQIVLVSACDIIRTGQSSALPLEQVARLYFDVGERFGLGWLRYNAEKLPADTHWQKLAADAMIEELYGHQRSITVSIVNAVNGKDRADPMAAWSKSHSREMDQASSMLNELETSESVDFSMLAVASRQLGLIAAARGD